MLAHLTATGSLHTSTFVELGSGSRCKAPSGRVLLRAFSNLHWQETESPLQHEPDWG